MRTIPSKILSLEDLKAPKIFKDISDYPRGVVLVTIQYRLGTFGFLSLPALSAESPQHVSGNYGLMDQIAGRKWVKENIAEFGAFVISPIRNGRTGTAFTSEALEAYAREVGEVLPLDAPAIYPVSGGSEAIESALKIPILAAAKALETATLPPHRSRLHVFAGRRAARGRGSARS